MNRMAAPLLASLERVEAELQRVIQDVRAQVELGDEPPEKKDEETKTAEDDVFRGDPPAVMQQVLRDRAHTNRQEGLEGVRARQQAAVLRDVENDERLNLQLSPHFMELSMRSGGALHGTGAQKAVGQIRYASALRSSRTDLSESQMSRMVPDFAVVAPYSRKRFTWDLVGTCLIILDVIILPLTLAWQIDKKLYPMHASFEAMCLQLLAWTNLLFWPLDILFNFNTGFHKKGVLIMKRRQIATHYVHTWLAFDVTVILIDWALSLTNTLLDESNAGYLQPLRSARYLRVFRSVRILRVMKSRKMNVRLENWVIGFGQQNLVLAFNVLRMLLSILLTAHLLACTWFGVGKFVSQTGESWIDVAGVGSSSGPVQYLHSLSWVVQPPSVPELGVLHTDSLLERIVSIMMVVVTVLVIGSALSLLTGTLQEIRTINNQRSRKRRELRTYLHSQSAPTELVMRIMSFADYKLDRHSPVNYDRDLISPLLVAELAVWQKGHLMRGHPLFALTSEAFPKVFADICGALKKELYYEGESAFLAGLLAESMYITSHGSFVVYDSFGQELEKFSNTQQFFSEVALYVDTVMHNCTLTIETFAEVYTLSGDSITSILLHSPICASMFVEYAKEFIAIYSRTAVQHHHSLLGARMSNMSQKESVASWQVDMKCARGALRSNSFYMDMNLQDDKMLRNVSLEDLGEGEMQALGLKEGTRRRVAPPISTVNSDGHEGELWHSWPVGSEMHHEVEHHQDTSSPDPAAALVQELMRGNSFTSDQLQEAFIELHPVHGLHTMYSQQAEQEKAVCACFSLAALMTDDYESFTEPQQEAAKLHHSQWQQLRDILKWADPTKDVLEAAFFLLAVRSLGKCRAVTRQLPREAQKPEEALLYILEHYPNVVPSFSRLTVAGQDLVCLAVELQQGFSFPQMLQGENVPANLLQLQHFLEQNGGGKILKFYIVFLLGFLSALQGGNGSLFMTHSNAKNIILGLSTVQHALDKEAGFLYWMYIYQRGCLLNRLPRSGQDLAVLRLACLCRAKNAHEFDELENAWHQLDEHQQGVLTNHFLASGIQAPAIVFEFLPLCLEHARNNPHVSIPAFLDVLVSLIEAIWVTSTSSKITRIDLSNFAAFISSVQKPFIFQTCLSRSKLRLLKQADFQLDMTEGNWNRINEAQSDMEVIASSVQTIIHRHRRKEEGPTISM